jgi:hypothetical protein
MATKTRGGNGDVWETFGNSILLLSYLVYYYFQWKFMIFAHNPTKKYHWLLMNFMVLFFSKVPKCIYSSLILPSIFYRMLFAFVKEQRNNKDNDNLYVTYFIAGLSHSVNGIKVCVYIYLFIQLNIWVWAINILLASSPGVFCWRATYVLAFLL